jgi:hypothetical protein
MEEGHVRSRQLDEIGELTREYASYSRDAVGLGGVLGGLLYLLTRSLWYSGRRDGLDWVTVALIVATPLIWITAQEWLRRWHYQSEGLVQQRETLVDRIAFWSFAVVGTAVSIAVAFSIWAFNGPSGFGAILRATVATLIVLALPVVTGWFLRGRYEYFVGACMMLHAARAIYSWGLFHYASLASKPDSMPPAGFYLQGLIGTVETGGLLCAVLLIVEGWKQHQKFRQVRDRLTALRVQA